MSKKKVKIEAIPVYQKGVNFNRGILGALAAETAIDTKEQGGMIRRADGSYSQRGLWDNIRANAGSGKKPTKEMLQQERKIRAAEKKQHGGWLGEYQQGGTVLQKDQEVNFQKWKSSLPKRLQYEGDYDLRGFWKENPTWSPSVPGAHMTDKYKLPNHPTFSNESIYFNNVTKDRAGHWLETDSSWNYIPYNPSIKDTIIEHKQMGGYSNSGVPKAQYGRAVNSKSTDSLRHLAGQMMDYEAIKGSPIGTPLSNWGYHQSQLPYNQVPSNWTPPRTKQEAVDMYMKEIAGSGKLDYYPSAMEKAEAGDFLYNTGRDARAYMIDQYLKSKKQSGIPNRSLYNVDTKSPKWTPELQQSLDQQWSLYEGEIMKLPTNDRRILLNKGRDFFYQNINRVNDQPNPSYEATWKPRIWESVNYYKKHGGYSITGYKADSPDRNNPYNIIPSGRITMQNVPHPVMGIDNFGNKQMMQPGGEYQFPGNRVFEVPAMQAGGVPPIYVDSINDPRYRAYQDSLILHNHYKGKDKTHAPKEVDAASNRLRILNHSLWFDHPTEGDYEFRQPIQPIKIKEKYQINKLPIINQQSQPYIPQQVPVPPYTPKIQGEWYSNNVGIPIDAEDVSALYNEDGTRKYQNGGHTMKRKVQIISAPKYDTGGQWASQKGMELYTPWPLSVHQQTVADPQYRMKSTLQPVPRQQSDIEAEKGEHIVGDFNQDGAPESMAVGGKRHSEGGTPLSVPDGAFVYSDTQKLKIKDPDVLSVFDTKKAATPGKLAKKYPLNEYKALMDNPKTDPLTRKTAEMMYGNNLKKLGQLQVVQEGMKESMGIPASPQQPTMRHGGNIPKFIEGGKKNYDDYTDKGDPQQIQNREYSTQRPSPSPIRRKIQITAAPQNTAYRFDQNPTDIPNIPGVSPTPGNMQQGLNEPTIGSLKPAQSTMPVSTPQYSPSMVDVQPYVPKIPKGTNRFNKMLAGAKDAIGNYRGMNADDMATVALGLKALNTRKYTPWEAPVQVSYPELILESDQPIRNALSEVTNTMQQGLYAGDQKAGRAAALASQGQLLSQAAQAVGQVSNRNAQMANQYSGQIANITNERLAQERERAKRLYDGNIISAQEYQNSLNNLMSEYVGQQAIREQKESERAWMNKTSPYFAVDRRGMPVFKSAEAQAKYQQEVLNMKPGESDNTSKTYDDWYKFYTENMKVPPDAAKEMAAKKIEESTKLPHTSKTVSKKTASGTERTTTKKIQGKYGGLLAFINRK